MNVVSCGNSISFGNSSLFLRTNTEDQVVALLNKMSDEEYAINKAEKYSPINVKILPSPDKTQEKDLGVLLISDKPIDEFRLLQRLDKKYNMSGIHYDIGIYDLYKNDALGNKERVIDMGKYMDINT